MEGTPQAKSSLWFQGIRFKNRGQKKAYFFRFVFFFFFFKKVSQNPHEVKIRCCLQNVPHTILKNTSVVRA